MRASLPAGHACPRWLQPAPETLLFLGKHGRVSDPAIRACAGFPPPAWGVESWKTRIGKDFK